MPPKPVQPPFARQNKMMLALIAKYQSLKDMDKPALALRMHMSKSTLYQRLKAPGDLSLDQVRRMCAALGLTDEEILALIK